MRLSAERNLARFLKLDFLVYSVRTRLRRIRITIKVHRSQLTDSSVFLHRHDHVGIPIIGRKDRGRATVLNIEDEVRFVVQDL